LQLFSKLCVSCRRPRPQPRPRAHRQQAAARPVPTHRRLARCVALRVDFFRPATPGADHFFPRASASLCRFDDGVVAFIFPRCSQAPSLSLSPTPSPTVSESASSSYSASASPSVTASLSNTASHSGTGSVVSVLIGFTSVSRIPSRLRSLPSSLPSRGVCSSYCSQKPCPRQRLLSPLERRRPRLPTPQAHPRRTQFQK